MTRLLQIDGVIRRAEPFFVEFFLFACGIWVSKCFILSPDLFVRYHQAFVLVQYMGEPWWTLLIMFSTCTQAIGFGLSRRSDWAKRSSGAWLRAFGLTVAGVFWFMLGILLLSADPNTITSVPFMLFAVAAWSVVLRFPAEMR